MKNYFAESSYMNSEKFEEEIEILKENYPDADLSRSYTIISANGMFHLGFPKEINPDLQRDIIRRLINL